MKAIKLCLIIVIAAIIINFIKTGQGFHIAKSLPFSNAPDKVSLYDWAGVAVLIILAWGLYRIKHMDDDED